MTLKDSINDLHKYRTPIFMLFIFCMMAAFSFLAMSGMQNSIAASLSDFKAGNIISDAVMGNYNSMTKDEIQRFLTSKNSCSNRNYSQYQSLKAQYPNTDWYWRDDHFVCLSEERFGDGLTVGSGQTAAEIIYEAAQDYRINPQVLIVLLEKEQGLITDSFPNSVQYRSATGYGCPDTAACDSKYYGFKNQVRNAASLFRNVLDHGYSAYPEQRSGVYVRYSPNASCGGSEVFIENRATAALYRYTPYQPNSAALAANYGLGDSCSAYGNRNFYLYFTDWFGSTQQSATSITGIIPDGVYGLAPKDTTTTTMATTSNSKNNGANVALATTQGSTSNQWKFTRNPSTGYYTITNVNSGLALDLNSGITNEGTNIQLWEPNTTCSQQWRIYQASDKYLTIESTCAPGKVLDRSNGSNNSGTNIQLWTSNSTDAQKWMIYTGQNIPDGMYAIQSKAIPGNKVVDVSGGNTANGTNLQMWSFDHLAVAQKWDLAYDNTTDSYVITNHGSGKALDVAWGNIDSGTNIQLYDKNSSCSQRWKILESETGYYTLMNACDYRYAIDVSGGNAQNNGTNIQLWSSNFTDAQKWQFQPIRMLDDGTYNIVSVLNSNRAIDVAGGGTGVGTNIDLWDRNYTLSQEWTIVYDQSKQAYTLTNPNSNKVLYFNGGKAANGVNIQLGNADGSCAQYWKLEQYANSSYALISTCSNNYVVDLNGGNSNNGGNIGLYTSNGTNSQRWFIRSAQAVGNGVYTIASPINESRAMDVAGGAKTVGTNIRIWDRNGTTAQSWNFTYNAQKNAYTLTNTNSNKVLYLDSAKATNGTNVHLGDADGSCAQYWKVLKNTDSTVVIISTCANRYVVDLAGGNINNGGNINLYETNGTNSQKWYLR